MNSRTLLVAVAATSIIAGAAAAQEATLKLHHFMPPQANLPRLVIDVWADNVEASSEGRIKIERYPSMQLGGAPPQLIDQTIDGIADVVFTVVGYTPGRFPRTEVFELPFMMTDGDARAASRAYWEMFEEHMEDTEFADLKVLGTWVHGPGVFHTSEPVEVPDDFNGMKIRGGSRLVNNLLAKVGANPVGMPITAMPEALSKGVIDGATVPWEVAPAMKVPDLVENHTEFDGTALYTLTFVMVMNKEKYDSLPEDLKAAIDENSGLEFSIFAGGTQADADGPGRQVAMDNGNNIITVSGSALDSWRESVQEIHDEWVADMRSKGIDGQALINQARAKIDRYAGAN